MATRTLDLPMWEAGRHVLIMNSPESWNALVDGWNIIQDNRKAVEGCRKAAARAKEAMRCKVSIASPKR